MKNLKKFILILFFISIVLISPRPNLACAALDLSPKTYLDVLATGIQPAYPPDMEVPHYAHDTTVLDYSDAFFYALQDLLEWKYGLILNPKEIESWLGWEKGQYQWSDEQAKSFASVYYMDIIDTSKPTAEYVFNKLAMGELLILNIPFLWDTNGDGIEENVGHDVVVYSFDQNGFWIADNVCPGEQRHLGYQDVFWGSASSLKRVTEFRAVKGGGTLKKQTGL
ncbi:MAG: hypothetical protein UT55_C0075G0002 [Candidatus Peregrinibacteria bacterium GW2011_GWE2_39_6]|nr:MAG: hypothetical protein UT36_C0001G0151 [Candidatus Peregrinibacteria bacterium GW2011_GWF2_39_17]KKR24053.1 MAG: hypothetical protein UT55_C0075G0002 [Candidatus Peregrinibacteria bacterium GW2011_GWE2_39_6]HCW32589.1 hypothetical protein [Candidatus Peregrinibacteria bacterium]